MITKLTSRRTRLLALGLPMVAFAVVSVLGSASDAMAQGVAQPATTTRSHHAYGALTPKTHVLASPRKNLVGEVVSVPASVNLRGDTVTPKYQGDYGTCVSWAIGYALMGWEAKHKGLGAMTFAPYYIYSQLTDGDPTHGTYPSDAMPIARDQGVDITSDYSQQPDIDNWQSDWQTKPTAAEKANAKQWRISGFTTLYNSDTGSTATKQLIQQALAAGHPVPISFNVEWGFETNTPATDNDASGDYVLNDDGSTAGHEVLAVGYDAEGLTIQNSWGANWGDNGFRKLSWAVVAKDVTSAFQVNGFVYTPKGTVDTTGPSVGVPTSTPALGGTLGTTGATIYTTKFAASDPSGIGSTVAEVSVDGAAWSLLTLPSAAATSFNSTMYPGHTYRYVVGAYDGLGNWSGWQYGTTFSVLSYGELASNVVYSSGWVRAAYTPAVGGQVTYSSTSNASATLTFTGKAVTWVGTKATTRGQAYVYADGVYQGYFDEYGTSTVPRSVILTTTFAASGTHTLKIVVIGTAGRPTVDIDNFIVTK